MASAEKFAASEKYDGSADQSLGAFSFLQDNVTYFHLLEKKQTDLDLLALGFASADDLLHEDSPPSEVPTEAAGPVIHRKDDGTITEIDLAGGGRLLVNAQGDFYFADASGNPTKDDRKEPLPVIPSGNVEVTDDGDVKFTNLGKSSETTYFADGRIMEHVYNSTRTWDPNNGTLTTVSDHVDGMPDVTDIQFSDGSSSHMVEDAAGSSTTRIERPDGTFTVTTITNEGHVLTFDKLSDGKYVWKRDGRLVEAADPTGDGNNATVYVTQPDGSLLIYDDIDMTNVQSDGSVVDREGHDLLVNGHTFRPHYDPNYELLG